MIKRQNWKQNPRSHNFTTLIYVIFLHLNLNVSYLYVKSSYPKKDHQFITLSIIFIFFWKKKIQTETQLPKLTNKIIWNNPIS